jgi:dTDP-4-dehydrorhamnose reductase
MSRIAVIGAGGMLGHAVGAYLTRNDREVCALSRAQYDIAREPLDRLASLLDGVTEVVNCAGVIKPRVAETPIEHVLRVNSAFPQNLAKLSRQLGFRSYHVTTDCVFSGTKQEPYTEDDVFDADDVYGLSKNGGDSPDNMVLRTSIIGEEKGQSRSLLEWARSQAGRQVKGFVNHTWNGLTTLYLAEVIVQLIDEDRHRSGVFHVHSPDTVSKFELVQMISDVYELDLRIEPVEVEQRCDRNLGSVHPLSREVAVKPIRQQLEEMRRFFQG